VTPEPGFLTAAWAAPNWVKAVVTTRAGGVSRGAFAGNNMADHVGDDPAAVAANRDRIEALLDLPAEPCWMVQQHGNRVIDADPARQQADACIAARPNVVCAVLTADCLPLLLCDTERETVAAVHVGWRGLCSGIIEATLAALEPSGTGLMAWLGPTICRHHYAIGPDVRDAALDHNPGLSCALKADGASRWRFDLPAAASWILREAGVAAITDSGICTYADQRFFSHRRGHPTGRMAAMIWMEHA
jgi:YfiH family protein